MELGSDFNLRLESLQEEKNTVYEYMQNYYSVYLDSGRSGLRLVRDTMLGGEILVPDYICASVLKSFNGMNIKFYQINPNLEIDIEDLLNKISKKTKAVYLMHYFGAVQSDEVCAQILEKRTKIDFKIIEDTTHSLFSNPRTIGDYCICSLRKWFAIPDGGVLYSHKPLDKVMTGTIRYNTDTKKIYAMILKTLYLDKMLDCNAIYKEMFESTEAALDVRKEILLMTNASKYLLKYNNIKELVQKRKENFRQLQEGLSYIGLVPIGQINPDDCPFTFPIRISNRDRFRQFLIDHKIYCAVHWPLNDTVLYNIEPSCNLSKQIISLPIDQRYGRREIQYLLEVINKYERITQNANNLTCR